jgi:aspartate-semialdehyde dehydrogenase
VALENERAGVEAGGLFFPHGIDRNVIPQCDVFLPDGFTREEEKTINETRRLLGDPGLRVHPTCARVPVMTAHSEAIHVELRVAASRQELRACLEAAPGVRLLDDPEREAYPLARDIEGSNEVWVGRIRQDRTDPKIAELWVVADNLRKGAAWNAVQIAHLLHAREQ